jgi:probable phosphoglycerate mutase
MLLYLVRHGQSLYNVERRIQGQADVELSPLGLKQSVALAHALANVEIDAIYASPLRRALGTAQPLAAALKLAIQTDDRLKEIHAGVFQGLRWDEIDHHAPEAASRWRQQDPDFVIPDGESRRAVAERGHAALRAIRDEGHRRAVVVAHGGVLAGALNMLLGIPAELNPFSLYNASISMLAWNGKIKLLTLNQTDHLKTAGLDLLDGGEF